MHMYFPLEGKSLWIILAAFFLCYHDALLRTLQLRAASGALALPNCHTSCCPSSCWPQQSHKAINWQSFSLIKGQLLATDSREMPTGEVLVAADGSMCWLCPRCCPG